MKKIMFVLLGLTFSFFMYAEQTATQDNASSKNQAPVGCFLGEC